MATHLREPYWEHYDHEADMGVRGVADTLAGAFEQAALAMTAVIIEPEKIAAEQVISIHCEATDPEVLFVDWLNALVYEIATRKMLFSRFQVNIDNGRLEAQAWGEPLNVLQHQPAVEIKGATFTTLAVSQDEDGMWTAQTVVDV